MDESQKQLVDALIQAATAGDVETLEDLLNNKGGDEVLWLAQDEHGRTPLHYACMGGHYKAVSMLLEAGHPWNVVDNNYRSAGEEAKANGYSDVYELMVNWGIRVELLLDAMQSADDDNDTDEPTPNQRFLQQKLHYSSDNSKLLDSEGSGVMMGWEKPLMEKHAEVLCPKEGLDVLNVGFGLGLIDTELQKYKPRTHTIIEAHPDVYAQMLRLGWDKKPNVKIIFGRWQDVVDQLETYDAIFWDTFSEDYRDQRVFHEIVADVLRPNGIFSFFNGLGGNNVFFHDVYCRIVEIEFSQKGMSVEYLPIDIDPSANPEVWDGVKHKYWTLKTYNLPIIKWKCK